MDDRTSIKLSSALNKKKQLLVILIVIQILNHMFHLYSQPLILKLFKHAVFIAPLGRVWRVVCRPKSCCKCSWIWIHEAALLTAIFSCLQLMYSVNCTFKRVALFWFEWSVVSAASANGVSFWMGLLYRFGSAGRNGSR